MISKRIEKPILYKRKKETKHPSAPPFPPKIQQDSLDTRNLQLRYQYTSEVFKLRLIPPISWAL